MFSSSWKGSSVFSRTTALESYFSYLQSRSHMDISTAERAFVAAKSRSNTKPPPAASGPRRCSLLVDGLAALHHIHDVHLGEASAPLQRTRVAVCAPGPERAGRPAGPSSLPYTDERVPGTCSSRCQSPPGAACDSPRSGRALTGLRASLQIGATIATRPQSHSLESEREKVVLPVLRARHCGRCHRPCIVARHIKRVSVRHPSSCRPSQRPAELLAWRQPAQQCPAGSPWRPPAATIADAARGGVVKQHAGVQRGLHRLGAYPARQLPRRRLQSLRRRRTRIGSRPGTRRSRRWPRRRTTCGSRAGAEPGGCG